MGKRSYSIAEVRDTTCTGTKAGFRLCIGGVGMSHVHRNPCVRYGADQSLRARQLGSNGYGPYDPVKPVNERSECPFLRIQEGRGIEGAAPGGIKKRPFEMHTEDDGPGTR